ncbi:MAG TPA: hypothetical protein VE998_04030 [Terriglobales bacterium]|nr:hypothetical protein [Terriglobales bacterium]
MNSSNRVLTYQPEANDLHQIIHELANVLQRCLSLRIALDAGTSAAEEDLLRLRESVQHACMLVHRIAEKVETLPCAHGQRRPIRSQRF